MTGLQTAGLILLLLVLAAGIGIKIYTRRTLRDMDGLDETVVGEAREVYGSINRDNL